MVGALVRGFARVYDALRQCFEARAAGGGGDSARDSE